LSRAFVVSVSMTRYDQLRDECRRFHAKHPDIWDLFEQFTRQKIRQGFKNYSARGVFHRIRWETEKPKYKQGEEFKLNDHHSPFYARRFMRMYPDCAGFFRTRVQLSKATSPTSLPPLGPADFD